MNKCIFVDAANELSVREIPEFYRPRGSQSLVKVRYSGINPADLNHTKHLGMNNNVCGYEICGTVIEAGETSRYTVGDIVFGSNKPGRSKPAYHGGHQDFAILESDTMSMKLPSQVPNADAAALGIMVRSAGDALINLFEIPFPAINVHGPPAAGGLLVWGGASAVGTAAIQLAKAMELSPIFAVASSANHNTLLELGATKCFDYRDSDVVKLIGDAAGKEQNGIKYVFDTVCKEGSLGTMDLCELIATEKDVKFAGCLPQFGRPRWKLVMASRGADVPVPFELPGQIGKANMQWESRLERTVAWAANTYGVQFRIPNVTIVKGAERGIQAIRDVNEGKVNFAKIVIEHPL
ncbi:hypothetical protein TCE0_018r05868 [Talaromyces pinophilus]|uniref:Enoyl reductase (ER) domain-containing protein n=1 Tax=Talaromyces pinophilus TaxID=128442 RepID=A0A510NX51_TALPI|nr:hypothetical protein TCE0_018r05868 [Talaromyces pinophilus]